MRRLIVIPARAASQRYPGKPLAPLRGANGTMRPLIERSWRAALAVPGIARVVIATDDTTIAATARNFGADVVMTPESCRNGTERCAAALAALGDDADIVINVQGDAPLTPPDFIGALAARLDADRTIAMATPATACSPSVLAALVADQNAGRVGGTTVVFDHAGRALYFSKRIIPYVPCADTAHAGDVHLHLGVYAYRPAALAAYARTAPSRLEELEGLEQLRFLAMGEQIGVVRCATPLWDPIELNNPEDVPLIEAMLAARGID